MQVIGITGLIRAGKDTVADYLVEKHGFKKFGMSDVLANELKKRGKQITKRNLADIGDELRAKHGQAVVSELLAQTIQQQNPEKVVIVGFRSLEELNPVRKFASSFQLVVVTAPEETRFERRSEKDPNNREDFFERDKIDLENKGLQKVIDAADIIIDNTGTLEELFSKTEQKLKKKRKIEKHQRKRLKPPKRSPRG